MIKKNTEIIKNYRYGDDDKGNIIFPAISICKQKLYLRYCDENVGTPPYIKAFECIETLKNISKFIESIHYKNPLKGKPLFIKT